MAFSESALRMAAAVLLIVLYAALCGGIWLPVSTTFSVPPLSPTA